MKHLLFLISISLGLSQSPLQGYIKQAIENNLELKQKTFKYEQATQRLRKAKGMFLPQIDLNARYTRSGGGRTIDLPLGSMLNPLYSQHGLGTPFEDQHIRFLREKEHETKLTLTQHIFNLKIYNNYKLNASLEEVALKEKDAFKHELIKEVTHAYLAVVKLEKVTRVYETNLHLLQENKRVTESLFKNGKVTQDAVYLAEVDLLSIKKQLNSVQNQLTLAKKYVNHLRNVELSSAVETDDLPPLIETIKPLEELKEQALHSRNELKQLTHAIISAEYGKKIAAGSFFPNVLLSGTYGFQGEEYRFDSEHDYWMLSGVVQWNLFKGFQDRAETEEKELEIMIYESMYNDVLGKIKLEVERAYTTLKTVREDLNISEVGIKNASLAFHIVQKKYNEGLASYIEYLNALTKKQNQELAHEINKINYRIQRAELEYATGESYAN